MADERTYNDPIGGTPSEIGSQFRTDYYYKKALIEAKKEQYFMPLADVTAMPKHMGKTIKRYHYLPLLDDENINDQGIDATGASIVDGNLYGSSKDIGTIPGKLPTLSETGGRVNRIGFTRKEIEGSISRLGFFDEYTQESLDFDTDEELEMHVSREMIRAAHEISEDALQLDLLNGFGVERFAGAATADNEIDDSTEVTYDDIIRLSIDLDNNRCPKQTKIITGTRMIDTRVVDSGRVMYIGSELIPTIRAMADSFGNPAFIPRQQYAAAGELLNGEIGSIDQFRVVVVPEMMKWAGAGAADGGVTTHYATGGNFDIFPMLVVGSGSFTTIGFQTDGKSVKFKIIHKKPGRDMANSQEPYGETGFMSIKWYYGTMVLRPEWLACLKTSAKK